MTSPTVICTGRQPFSTLARNHTRTGPCLQHLAQLQAGGAGDADAGQRRHLGLVGLGRRVAPHRLHRAERHRRVLWVPPVHHHAAGRAHDGGDALLLVARGVIGELGERDLAGGVAPLVLAEGAGGDVDQLGRDAVGQRRQAVAQRVGLDRQLHRRQHAHLGLLAGSSPAPASRARARRRRPWSAPRRCIRPCACRWRSRRGARGSAVVMCSTWAFTLAAETALTTPSSDMLTLATHHVAADRAQMPRSSKPAAAEYLAANSGRCHERLDRR